MVETPILERKILFLAGEKAEVEDDKVGGTEGDAGVGKVEDRLEEDVAAQKRNPVGPGEEREVEHVYHLAEEEGPVNHRIENVSGSSGGNHRESDKNTRGNKRRTIFRCAAKKIVNPPYQGAAKPYAENRENELADNSSEFHPEGHTLILDVTQTEPVAQYGNLLARLHSALDQEFDHLVKDYQKEAENYQPFSSRESHRLMLAGEFFLGFDGEGGVRHEAQALLWNQFAGFAADAIGLVFNADESGFQVLDELVLALCHLAGLFFGQLHGAVVFDSLEGRSSVLDVVGAVMHHDLAQAIVLSFGLGEFLKDNLLEFGQLFIAVTQFGFFVFHNYAD